MWQQLWFVINLCFVALLIGYMFLNRSVTMARYERDEERLRGALRKRRLVGVLTVVAFVAMAAAFLINMRVNG